MESTVKIPSIQPGEIRVSGNATTEEIQRIYQSQQANRQKVKNSTAADRVKKLKKLKKAVLNNRDIIQQALADDLRRPLPETDLVEIFPLKTEIEHAVKNLSDWMQPKQVDTPLAHIGSSSKVIYEAKGVTLNISPWNYPFQLSLIPVVSAVSAGCTMIIKPSEYTPATNAAVKKVISESFDENEIAVLEGDHEVAQELTSMKFDHIYFTGSPAVGKIIMRAAAEHLTSVTLELGGKSPVVVDETANVKEAAKKTAWGKFINCGQTCIAPDYVMVHDSKAEKFKSEFIDVIQSFYGETDESVQQSEDLTRIINKKHFFRLKGLIEDAVSKGAEVIYGGNLDENENYIQPTVLMNVPADAKVMHEEIFGPILPIQTYTNKEETIAEIESREKPLAMYIFTKSKKNREFFLAHSSAGGTCINDTLVHNSHENLPFGGVNNSGIGKGHGEYGFMEFSNARAVYHQHLANSAAQGMYPPYTNGKKTMIDLTLKWM